MSIDELMETARICGEQAALGSTAQVRAALRRMAEHYQSRAVAQKRKQDPN
jgi:hypothetical protein